MITDRDGASTPEEDRATLLRTRVLAAAQSLVDEAGGVTVSLDNLGMDKVIKAAKVSRTSAYREWPTREAFMVDLMCAIVGPQWQGPEAFSDDTHLVARDTVADHLDRLATLPGRRWVLGEMIRVAVELHLRTVLDSPQWRANVAIAASLPATPDEARHRLHAALMAAEETWLRQTERLFEDLAILIGFRPAPHSSYTDIAVMLSSVCEGFGLRQVINPDAVWHDRTVDRPEGKEQWGLVSLTCIAALEAMIEFDLDHDPGAALPPYLKRLTASAGGT